MATMGGRFFRLLLGGVSAAALTFAGVAAEPSDEEIVVTARKRAESSQDVPVALSAFDGAALEKRGLDNLEDLQAQVPGLNFGENIGSSGAQIAIRGIGSENLSPGGDPGVAVHVDGVYVQSPTFLGQEFFDIARVEVLRGPQGTLYGRNATGGAINIVTVQPSSELSGKARVTLGDYGLKEVNAAIGGALGTPSITGRLAASITRRDGYSRNVSPLAVQDEADTADVWTLRGALRFQLSDAASLTVRGHYLEDEGIRSPLLVLEPYPVDDGSFTGNLLAILNFLHGVAPGDNPTLTDARTYAQNTPTRTRAESSGASAEFSWEFGEIVLTSVTGYNDDSFFYEYDVDGNDRTTISFNTPAFYETYSEELRLSSTGTQTIDWVLGAYFYHERSGFSFDLPIEGLPTLSASGRLTAESMAIFGQATWHVSDAFSLTGGLRYTNDEKKGDDIFLGAPAGGPYEANWNSTNWLVTAQYEPSEDLMLYASVSTGYKAGGFNLAGFQAPYNPEEVTAYEIGVKSVFADGRILLNVSGFYYDYSDLQVTQIIGPTQVISNAATATSQGIELETVIEPVDGLRINASLSYLDATYDDFTTQDPRDPLAPPAQLAGNHLNRAPEWKFAAGIQYEWSLGEAGSLLARLDFAWIDEQFYTPFNDPRGGQAAFHKTDLRLTWSDELGHLAVTAWVKNIEDEDTIASVRNASSALGATFNGLYAPPRTFGLTLDVNL